MGGQTTSESVVCQYTTEHTHLTVSTILYYCNTVMEVSDGNGVGRIIEATGSPDIAGSCFSLLRYGTSSHTSPCHVCYRKGGKICLVGLIKVGVVEYGGIR